MNNSPFRRRLRTKASRLVLSHDRRCKDMRSARSKCPGNFTESGSRVKQVLEDILSDVQIEALILEAQVFEVLATDSIHDLSCGDVSVIVTRNIPWCLIL